VSATYEWHGHGHAGVREIRRRLFVTRGPTLLLLVHAPSLLEARQLRREELGDAQVWTVALGSAPAAGELVSVGLTLPASAAAPRVRLAAEGLAGDGGKAIPLQASSVGRATSYLSQRIRRCPGEAEPASLVIELTAPPPPKRVGATLYRFAAQCSGDSTALAAAGSEALR
jgi:hypothetical protein